MNKAFSSSSRELHLYVVTLRRIALVMALFSLTRLAFYGYNRSFFPDLSPKDLGLILLGGLRFDTTAVLYTNLLYLFLFLLPTKVRYQPGFQAFQKGHYLLLNALVLLANLMDMVYFPFVKRRTTYSILTEFAGQDNLGKILWGALGTYWYVGCLWLLVVGVLWLSYGKPLPLPLQLKDRRWLRPVRFYLVGSLVMLLSAGFIVVGLRGSFARGTFPITLINAGEHCSKPLEMALVLNTPFSIYKTIERSRLEEVHFYASEATLERIYTPVHQPDTSQPFQPLNVVVIILESFGYEYVGAFNRQLDNGHYPGYTPFLDSLIEHSKTFRYSLANGEKSIDALPSVVTSLPYIQEHYVLFPYAATNTHNSLATALQPKGYQTAFFHGGHNGSMGFQSFLKQVGYRQYYGKDEYNHDEDFDGVWGIWDEPFLQFMAQKINTFKPPFLATCFTVSSHDPYQLPPHYEGKFPKGTLPIHPCIGYSDWALKRFFQTASQMPWFKNTLFVLCADHTNQSYFPDYKTDVGIYRIPIVFYQPGKPAWQGIDTTRLVQQLDIMPTVLDYLHYDKPYVAFGKNVFCPSSRDWAFSYNSGTYQYFLQHYLLQYRNGKTVGLFDFKQDHWLKHNLVSQHLGLQIRMEQQLKAFLQQYTHRVIHDKMTVQK